MAAEGCDAEVRRHEAKLKEMKAMVARYSADLPSHVPSQSVQRSEGDAVLLTGGTGGLGTHVLVHLVASAAVAKVYVLNRKATGSHQTHRARQSEALVERGLDPSVLDSPKVVLLEGDFHEPGLGLGEQHISEVCGFFSMVITYPY